MSLKFPISLVGKRGGLPLPTPLHWWDLNNISGTSISDQGNGTNDMSLTANGLPTQELSVAPDGGAAVLFGSNSYFDTNSDFTWDGDATAMSTQMWVYVDSVGSANSVFMSWRELSGDRIFMNIRRVSDTYIKTPKWDDTDTLTNNTDDAGLATSTGEWLHIVSTWAKNGDLKTYINGSIVSGATASAGSNDLEDTNTMAFAINAASWSKLDDTNRFQGNAWAFGIWDEELTADQVSTLYNSGGGGKYADYTWT